MEWVHTCVHACTVWQGRGNHREECPLRSAGNGSQLRWGILGPNPGWSKHVMFTFQGVLNPLTIHPT